MTNTLHRYGAPETLKDDYIVFAMAARGINDEGSVEKFKTFLEIARKHGPINLGDAVHGGVYRPSKRLNPLAHWFRKDERDPESLVKNVDQPTVVSAVFDDPKALEAFLVDIKKADLGLSVNISALTDSAAEIAKRAGITRHSVEYSLGFLGALDKLPDRATLSLATMCGHGMISFSLAKKMIDWVKQSRRSPEEASAYMARFCSCGIFNTTRSCRLLNECSHRNG